MGHLPVEYGSSGCGGLKLIGGYNAHDQPPGNG